MSDTRIILNRYNAPIHPIDQYAHWSVEKDEYAKMVELYDSLNIGGGDIIALLDWIYEQAESSKDDDHMENV